jgi:hypothetical protein
MRPAVSTTAILLILEDVEDLSQKEIQLAITALTADTKLVGNQVDRYHRSCVSFYSG